MALQLKNTEIDIIKKLLSNAQSAGNYDEVFGIVDKNSGKRFVISFLNMYAIQNALEDAVFLDALINSDLLLFDGIGVKLLCKVFKIKFGINMNGTDFIPFLLHKLKSRTFLVFASNKQALDAFQSKFSDYNFLLLLDGFRNYAEYIEITKQYNSDVILLGMGMPKQELLSAKIESQSIIINGGAAVDYMGGVKKRSPEFFIFFKIEWLYRIFYEPKRLFKRYFDGFILMARVMVS